MVSSIRRYARTLWGLFHVFVPVRRAATASLPTEYGEFTIHVYETLLPRGTHVALVCGEIGAGRNVLTRVHSTCPTGDIFHSVRCSCGAQLETSLRRIAAEGRGVLLYLNQERRGTGLTSKIRAYTLEDQDVDTVKANETLCVPADSRDYRIGLRILRDLGVRSTPPVGDSPRQPSAVACDSVSISD